METIICKPMPQLESVVDHFWWRDETRGGDSTIDYQILSDGLPGIIFQHYNGYSVVKDASGNRLPVLFTYGQATSSFHNTAQKKALFIGVSLKPLSLPILFGVPASLFTNKLYSLYELSSPHLENTLLNTNSPKEAIDILSTHLLNSISAKTKIIPILQKFQHHIIRENAAFNLYAFLKNNRVSERHLERLCKATIGLAPFQYYRIHRFQKSVSMLRSNTHKNTFEVAYELDYVDQSHFIREFKEFSGFTPKQFLKRVSSSSINLDEKNSQPLRLISYS